MNSITKRWIKGSLLIIIILLAVAEIFLVTTFRNSYYSAAQTALTNRVNTIEGTLAAYGRMSGEEKQRLMFLSPMNLPKRKVLNLCCWMTQAKFWQLHQVLTLWVQTIRKIL